MTRPPIVLVHGAWGGAWIWRRVLGPLRSVGHEVHAVTLTGDGERAHLRHAGLDLHSHIDDAVSYTHLDVYKRQVFGAAPSGQRAGVSLQ